MERLSKRLRNLVGRRNATACRSLLLLTMATVLSFAAGAASAQIIEEQRAPAPPPPSKEQKQEEPMETLKVDVNVVNILFNVKDKHGALIPDLKKDDFEVYEDGQKQTLKYFAAESNLPLTLGILIDTSGSQQRVLPLEQ